MSNSYWRLTVAATLLLLTSACTPPGTKKDGLVHWSLMPGYEWVDPGRVWSLETRWVAGTAYPGRPNIHAAAQQDFWEPDPGFAWTDDVASDAMAAAPGTESRRDGAALHVAWTAGLTHPQWPHVRSGPTLSRWLADKGYSFDNRTDDDLKVSWQPGTADPDRPHTIAAAAEGQWELEAGYQNSDYGPVWTSGTIHPQQSCLKASTGEGVWIPIDGYHFDRNDAGRIVIMENKRDTDWGKVFWGAVAAVIGLTNSQTHDDDSMIDGAGHAIAGEVGKAGFEAAAGELLGNVSGSCAGLVLPAAWGASGNATQ